MLEVLVELVVRVTIAVEKNRAVCSYLLFCVCVCVCSYITCVYGLPVVCVC